MNIVILNGSPHKNGTNAYLLDEFIRGAKESGHQIYRFDAAFKKVHPCIACDRCGCGDNPCVFQDDMVELWPELEKAELVVFASPLYYYSATAQLLSVVARFYAIDKRLKGSEKKAVLISSGTNPSDWAMLGIQRNYEEALMYLEWQDIGRVLARGCKTKEDAEEKGFGKQAHEMGSNIEEAQT